MLCNKIMTSSAKEKEFPEEWEYFRALADENESAFLVASGGIDTISFIGAEPFVMKLYGGINGTQLLYTLESDDDYKVDLWNSDTENFPLPTGLLFNSLQGKPYSDDKLGDIELFTVVTAKSDGSPVCVAVSETEYSALGLPYYRVLACDLNIPETPSIRGCVKNSRTLEFVFFKGGMTAIPPHAFYNTGLQKCEIPEHITSINSAAFYKTHIEEIYIHDGVTFLGDYMFTQSEFLKFVHLPSGATTLGGGTFSGCISLNTIEIPETYTSIGDTAFYGCRSLKEIKFPEGLKSIQPYLIVSNCDILDNIDISSTNTKVVNGTDMAANCHQLRYINMPNIILNSFGCQGKSAEAKNKIGYAERGDREAIVLDWANFDADSTISVAWNTSYTMLTEADYLTAFNHFYENGLVFTGRNFVITGSDGATDTVRDFITDKLGGICVG